MDRIVRAWVDGWVVSRGAAPPVVEPWGCTIDVGMDGHVTRHVLGAIGEDVTESDVRKVAGGVTGAGVRLKVFRDSGVVGGWLGGEWSTDPEPGYLMTLPLAPAADEPTAPGGYRVRTWSRGGVVRTMLAAPDGSWAARGQVAPTGATAVVDQVETSPAHRRKGLGTFVMRTLQRAAVEQGAEMCVLAGTPDGRALYESLGWEVAARMTNATFTGRRAP